VSRSRPAASQLATLALALSFTGAAIAQAPPAAEADARERAREQIARCAGEAEPDLTGLAAFEARCAGLDAALTTLGVRDALLDGADERIDAEALSALAAATRAALRTTPDAARLVDIARERAVEPASRSLWQRFKDWFQHTFLERGGRASMPWLEEWLRRVQPGELARDLLVWGLVILVAGTALVVVVRELRASDIRWVSWLRRRPAADGAERNEVALPPETDWRALDPAQRPAALFRQVALELVAAGRLPVPAGQTHRELAARARLDAAAERDAWIALARAAERQIYAPRGVAVDEAERAVNEAARYWARTS
jgi:hypothetical protein